MVTAPERCKMLGKSLVEPGSLPDIYMSIAVMNDEIDAA